MMFKQCKIIILTFLALGSFSTFAYDSTNFGVSLGTPSLANFVVKTDKLGIPLLLSGGYWGDKVSGIEAGFGFYQNNDSFFHSAQVITGYSAINRNEGNTKRWTYVGVSTTFKKGGFFIEPGLSVGSGTYSNPQLMIQIGWLWDL